MRALYFPIKQLIPIIAKMYKNLPSWFKMISWVFWPDFFTLPCKIDPIFLGFWHVAEDLGAWIGIPNSILLTWYDFGEPLHSSSLLVFFLHDSFTDRQTHQVFSSSRYCCTQCTGKVYMIIQLKTKLPTFGHLHAKNLPYKTGTDSYRLVQLIMNFRSHFLDRISVTTPHITRPYMIS